MGEYIEKQAALDRINQELRCGATADQCGLETAYDLLHNIPPADVRSVIFCRDCKHMGWIQEPCHGKSIDYCRTLEHPVDRLFFCGMGERKEADG